MDASTADALSGREVDERLVIYSGIQATLQIVGDRAQVDQLGHPLAGHDDPVASVAFSPDGRTVASGSDDHTVIL